MGRYPSARSHEGWSLLLGPPASAGKNPTGFPMEVGAGWRWQLAASRGVGGEQLWEPDPVDFGSGVHLPPCPAAFAPFPSGLPHAGSPFTGEG